MDLLLIDDEASLRWTLPTTLESMRHNLAEPAPSIQADVGQIRQVMLNLLLNALDATGHGGTIRIEMAVSEHPCEREGRKGRWLTLRVSDTGRGLPAGLGQRIFEPFVSTKETGLGLGLSISKRIVEGHEGEIQAADRPGGGAVFSVRLPCPEQTVSGKTGICPARRRMQRKPDRLLISIQR